MAKRCVNGIMCVGEVWRRVKRLAEGSPVTTTSVETPKAVADVWGAHRRRRDQSKRGLGGLAAHLGGGFGLLLGSCSTRVVPVSDRRDSSKYKGLPQA